MKEKIYNLSFDICHLSLQETGAIGFSSMANDKYQMTNYKSFLSSFILYPSSFFAPTHR
jgi:hypothetical protein